MASEKYVNVRKSKFTMISNNVLGDKELSLQAKGLLAIFLSNSPEWDLRMKEIIKRSKNGRDAHYSVVKELIEHGYFARVEIIGEESRKFEDMVYIFSDDKEDVKSALAEYAEMENVKVNVKKTGKKKPFPENPYTESQDAEKKPFPEKPYTGKPDTESQYNNNNKGNNTKINNTNLLNLEREIKRYINISPASEMVKDYIEKQADLLIKNKVDFAELFEWIELNVNDYSESEMCIGIRQLVISIEPIEHTGRYLNSTFTNIETHVANFRKRQAAKIKKELLTTPRETTPETPKINFYNWLEERD